MILSVTLRSLYALVSHLRLTGLPEVAMPYSDMWQDCRITFPHTRPCYAKSSYRSVDPQTLHGNVHQVDHVWTDQLRRDNNNGPIATPWRQESDATVRADYALTTTTCLGGSLSTKAARPRCSHYSASRMQLPDWCSA